MSDTRRRRKQSGGSDDLSDSYDELNVTKETQSSEQTDVRRDSEYDTAGSDGDSDGSQDGGERESGDGQEEDKPQRKLDDDEDRRNPQYIPKRGTFYEHDDRTSEETGETTAEPVPERETKEKKVWKDKEDRWNHDRYNDDEQAPKSHDELIAVYGYDIRNEEGPPRARRRRRYGRGPNKYTRNWEDEDAYGKTAGSVSLTGTGKNTGRRNRSGEEFPALGGTNKEASTESMDEPVISSAWYSNKNKAPSKQQNFPPLQSQQDNHKSKSGSSNSMLTSNENRAPNEPNNPAWKKEPKSTPRVKSPNRNAAGGGGSDTDKFINTQVSSPRDSKDPRKRQVHESVSLAANRARGRGYNRLQDTKPKGRGAGLISADPRRNHAACLREDDLQQQQQQHIGSDVKHQTPNDGAYNSGGRQTIQQRPNVVPPRMQQQQQQPPLSHAQQQVHPPPQQQQQQQQQLQQQQQQQQQQQADVTGNRPKRYSTLRQRPTIPEGPTQPQPPYPPQHPQHGFYPPQGFPQPHFEQTAPVGNSGAPMPGQPVIPLAPGGQPAAYAPPPFLVPPPQFITPQAAPPNIINYVPTPAGPPFQPNFQGYQGYNPTVQPQGPPPPPELFQPQGCTYYSPAQQQQQQVPMRRPKAAIPILPPPDTSNAQQYHQGSRGRGRNLQNAQSTNAPGNISLPAGVLSPQQQENDESVPPINSIESESSKSEAEVTEYERYEDQSTATSLPEVSEHETSTTSSATTASTIITNSEETSNLVNEKMEPQSIVIPNTPDVEITKNNAAEIVEQKEIIVETTKIDTEEKIEAVTANNEENTESVDSKVIEIVASNTSDKTVDIDVTLDEAKVSEPEKNVVLEKPVVEETAA